MLLERRGRVLAELAMLSYLSGLLPFVLVPRESFGGSGMLLFWRRGKTMLVLRSHGEIQGYRRVLAPLSEE